MPYICFLGLGTILHKPGVICEIVGLKPQKQAAWLPADPPRRQRHMHYWRVTSWRRKHHNIVPPNKRLDELVTRRKAHQAVVKPRNTRCSEYRQDSLPNCAFRPANRPISALYLLQDCMPAANPSPCQQNDS